VADFAPDRSPVFITVFTPTLNRVHTLPRVYESLRAQTCRDFEWLIIDNDSSDDTESVVHGWQREADIPIRYIRHPNRGLHVSWNRAVQEARGRFFVILPSDDSCSPAALERLKYHWDTIPEDERERFSGVAVLCVDQMGRVIGNRVPMDPTDSDPLEIRFKHKIKGEKWGFQRVDIMRRFPLPIIPGYDAYVPENLMWDAIARLYKTRYVNEPLRTFWLDDSESLSRPRNSATNAPGGMVEAEVGLNEDIRWARVAPLAFYLRASKYACCSFHCGRPIAAQWRHLRNGLARTLWLAALPLGWLAYALERSGVQPRRFLTKLRLHQFAGGLAREGGSKPLRGD
jgi:glycosyltransferase involved in cell wall biosynthesis